MFQRRHYAKLAKYLASIEPPVANTHEYKQWLHSCIRMAEMLQDDNPNMSTRKFAEAVSSNLDISGAIILGADQ